MQVFLSYAYSDKPVADLLRRGLEDCGIRVWSDEPARPGASVAELVASGINAADAFVVVLGRDTTSRQWSMLEIGGAIASGKPIVPVRIDRDAQVPLLLSDVQYLDLSDPASRAQRLGELCGALRRVPQEPHAGKMRTELVKSAADALRKEAEAYAREVQIREGRATRLELAMTVLLGVAATVTLIFLVVDSSDASKVAAAISAGLGSLAAAGIGFYFGSAKGLRRGSDDQRDRR